MGRPIVIGFLGRAGSGKSTATSHVVELWDAQRMAFAKPLKELAKLLWEFSDEQVYGSQAAKEAVDERWGITPRTAMIRLGDGGRNTLGKRIWIEACFNKILEDAETRSGDRPVYVIEDVRYPNEVEAIAQARRFDGFVIKLVCPDSDSSSAFADAPSERSVDEVPIANLYAVIESRKSPGSEDLKKKVRAVLASIGRDSLTAKSPLTIVADDVEEK